ncbi:tetratricopeptide repeat protein [Candidatus Desantisbacteria bacterium]|nr:tetratricopeptide repeat protein [Candidatus Desantisbacteria bacterium]
MKRATKISFFIFISTAALVISPVFGKMNNQEYLFKTSYDLFISKKFDMAIKSFSEYIVDYPKANNISSAYYLLGESYYGDQKYNEAIETFKKLLEAKEQSELFIRKINFSLAYAYLSSNQIENALDEFAHIVSIYPNTPEGLLSQIKIGDCFYDQEKFQQAAEVYGKFYSKIIQNQSLPLSAPEIGNRLAAALFKNGNFDESLKIYNDIIVKHPDWKDIASIKINQAIVNFYAKNIEKARNILMEIINPDFSSNPNNIAEAYYWLGRIAYEEKKYSEAVSNLYKALSYFPSYKNDLTYNTNFALAKIYSKMKKEALSEEILTSLINLPEERSIVPSAYFSLGEIYEYQGKDIKAINSYYKIIETVSSITSSDIKKIWEEWFFRSIERYESLTRKSHEENYYVSSLYVIAEFYFKAGYYHEAENIYTKITEDFHENAFVLEAWLKLSNLYMLQNKRDKIQTIYSNIVKNYPHIDYIDKIKISIAKSYYNTGNYDSAKLTGEEGLRLAKEDDIKAYAFYLIGKSYIKTEADLKALPYFQKINEQFPESNWAQIALYEIGWIQIRLKNYTFALEVFKQIQENYPYFKPENISINIADLYYKTADYRMAVEQYIILIEKSLNYKIRNHAIYWGGWSYIGNKDYKSAIEMFKLYIYNNPLSSNNILLYLISAECLRSEKKFIDASEIYVKIINNTTKSAYESSARSGFEKSFIQDNKINLPLKEIQLNKYEDTWSNEKLTEAIKYKYIPDEFPFNFTESFFLKFRAPNITHISYESSKIFTEGDEFTFTLRGTPDRKAFFELENYQKNIPMDELSPGVYRGTYKIKKQNSLKEIKISTYLNSYDNLKTYLNLDKKIIINSPEYFDLKATQDIEQIVYEEEALPDNLTQAEMDIKIYLLPDGTIEYTELSKGTGNNDLDKITLDKIKNKKYPPINSGSSDQSLRIFNLHVIYKLKIK